MEIISKISKGSKMDQVYISKNRSGFSIGSYVIIKPLETKRVIERPYFYNIKFIEPIKLEIIKDIFGVIDGIINYENIIITGSFLDEGFNFNDIDVLILSGDKINERDMQKQIRKKLKIETHIIVMNKKVLIRGLSTDPLYQMMLNKCIAKKRFLHKIKNKVNYKILDLHLLKSELLSLNFNYLNGNEKYYLIRNMMSIFLFLKHEKISKERVDKEIEKIFKVDIKEIKQNIILDKKTFLKKYKIIYKKTFKKIMDGIRNESKQKKTN